MAVRSIVCIFHGDPHEVTALETAIVLAKTHEALLRIVHVTYLARAYSGFFGEAAVAGMGFQDAIDRQNKERLDAARAASVAACARHDMPLDGAGGAAGQGRARAMFVRLENLVNSTLVRELSLCDLIVVGAEHGKADIVEQSATDLALFASRRPVLMVRGEPEGSPPPSLGGPCAVAWTDTPEAVQALINGHPLIADAGRAYLLVTADGDGEPADDQRMALDYLAAHGVEASHEVVTLGNRGAAEAVLARARELQCSFIVMGAYGHSVFREMLLGGFTESMLRHATMPLLLSH